MPRLNWGAVAVGAMAGLAGGLLAFAVVGLVLRSGNDLLALIFLSYLAQLGAGYVAGRLASNDAVLHGGAGAMLLFLVTTMISLSIAPSRPGVASLAFNAAVAAVLGTAGGSLADSRRAEPRSEPGTADEPR